MKTEYYTYAHIRNDTNKIFYIGKGKGRRAYITRNRNKLWKNIVAKHGYTVDILAYWSTEAEAFEHEEILIKCFRKMGYNLSNQTDGGEGISGLEHTEETRKKMSLSKKGKKLSAETMAKRAYLKGRPQSEEHQQSIAEGKIRNKGKPRKPYSDDYKANMSAIKKAKWKLIKDQNLVKPRPPISEETRAKMSATQKARYALIKQQKEQN
jgi:hypothetical protein